MHCRASGDARVTHVRHAGGVRPRSESYAFVLRVWVESEDPDIRGQVVSVSDGRTETAHGSEALITAVERHLSRLKLERLQHERLEHEGLPRDAAATHLQRRDDVSRT